MKVAPVSRSVANSVPELGEKVSFAAVSIMAMAAGAGNTGVSFTAVMFTAKVAVAVSPL